MTAERRQYPRYIIPEVDFEVFTRDAEIIGKIEDISKDGLAFRSSRGLVETSASRTISIIASGPERFQLPEISCRQVYEVSVLTEDRSFSGTKTCRCGLKFLDLNDVQEQQLDFLLGHYGHKLSVLP